VEIQRLSSTEHWIIETALDDSSSARIKDLIFSAWWLEKKPIYRTPGFMPVFSAIFKALFPAFTSAQFYR